MARLVCYPVGNGDCTLIDPDNHRLVVVDFSNRPADAGDDNKAIDLAKALDGELARYKSTEFAVVAFTHLDLDHIRGASAYFHLDHSKDYQGGDRRRIKTMWVPAAVITEKLGKDKTEDHFAIQKEARHRLRAGSGIVVFSCPPDLKQWLADNGLTEQQRESCIKHAGVPAPGFTKESDGVEFFVHAPVSSEEDISEDVARNETSLLMQVVFVAGGQETKVLMLSDAPHELLTDVVVRTERKKNPDRLRWDIVHIPHHCSYLSLGPKENKGDRMTKPVPEVERLYEQYGNKRGWLISSSNPVPDTDEEQPPHMQAANYYRKVENAITGMFRVTMEYPTETKPAPMEIAIEASGPRLVKAVAAGSAAIVSQQAPRAG